MAKMFQVYGIGQALIPVLPPPLPFANPPNSNQTNYEIGQVGYSPALIPTAFYMYAGAGNWVQFIGSSGDILAVNGTANQITASTSSGTVTLSIPSTFVAPGSIASTTTLTGGTGITATTGNIAASSGNVSASGTVTGGTGVTATTGNITATAGNFVSSAAGNGIVLNSPATSGAASGPVIVNGRSGQATFTSVSIAAAADLTLTITNSAITASTTQVLYSMSGATTGAALSIKSVTNTAGSSAIVVTNGTGATTSTADIVMNFLVLNA